MSKQHKYRRLEQASPEEITALTDMVNQCSWRQTFHIQPVTGLLNDPNGFSYYGGEYHLFYQWFPLGTYHGLKYWYHTKSKDLAFWHNEGIAIRPYDRFDSHGAYSGSAIEKDEKLYIMYTGNTRDKEWKRHPYQCLAVMDESGEITKRGTPLIDHVPAGYTEHLRDPKVWEDKDMYRCVIGAQRQNLTGAAVIYESPDLIEWHFRGEIKTKLDDFGYMWECPDYFELDGKGVLIFSPQGLSPEGDKYQNIFQSGYVIGKPLNRNTMEFEHGDFEELDCGFDFYAPQSMLDGKGRRLLVAWMGQAEVDYPTDSHGWAHCLTIPRELKLHNGQLIQQPVEELQKLRGESVTAECMITDEHRTLEGITGTAYEMICEFSALEAAAVGVVIRAGQSEQTVIRYDHGIQKVTFDRSASGEPSGVKYGTTRSCKLDADYIKLHLFVDTSSVELFINDGEKVFTSRIFPQPDSEGIRFFTEEGSAHLKVTKWDLAKAVD
ncbi:glycoside hydrolase family 32 protein [Paenibacillus dakarensis]|uniref:glycoside hydrolase family 32 protein n=1 Tax=Paenibacillus dakarensis TaxID=1527293 RepID=UPI0006D56F69|nr:sucrose-6-phosphate hydrolase [Paenibacillus dakarensis]